MTSVLKQQNKNPRESSFDEVLCQTCACRASSQVYAFLFQEKKMMPIFLRECSGIQPIYDLHIRHERADEKEKDCLHIRIPNPMKEHMRRSDTSQHGKQEAGLFCMNNSFCNVLLEKVLVVFFGFVLLS
jgi:hypothetical protein